ncbi:MAG: ribosome recycling factor [Anaerolineales bacterium]|nr:ribosome recycling factor [Anaerolineales bacterium]
MIKELLHETESRMKATITVLEQELYGMRTGRASTALVEKLEVEYYGTMTPLLQLAGISVPEPQTIMIRPYDRSTVGLIERAILASDLGLTPNSDGTNIRLNIPALTQERRRDLVKMMHKRLEDSKVAVRNVRRGAMEDLKEFEKEHMISEDEMHDGQDRVQKLTDKFIAEIDEIGKRKEHEIMEV